MGVGAMGARCARQLVSTPSVSSVVLRDPDHGRTVEVQASLSETSIADSSGIDDPVDADVVVLAGPAGTQLPAARLHLGRGAHIVATTDDVDEVGGLLALNDEAVELDRTVVVGAGFAPGLTDLLARHAAGRFTEVNEVHVGKVGTGGPACAQAHHRALAGMAVDWRDGQWLHRQGDRAGSWRGSPTPLPPGTATAPPFLTPCCSPRSFPACRGLRRVWPPPVATGSPPACRCCVVPILDGGPGAVRVEVRGMTANGHDVVVLGAMDRPAVAGGAVAALAAVFVGDGQALRTGAAGMAGLFDPLPLLVELAGRGVRCAVFDPQATLIT